MKPTIDDGYLAEVRHRINWYRDCWGRATMSLSLDDLEAMLNEIERLRRAEPG